MIDELGRNIGQFAHLAGLCLVIWALLSAVQSLERGDVMGGIFKAGMRGLLGVVLMKI